MAFLSGAIIFLIFATFILLIGIGLTAFALSDLYK